MAEEGLQCDLEDPRGGGWPPLPRQPPPPPPPSPPPPPPPSPSPPPPPSPLALAVHRRLRRLHRRRHPLLPRRRRRRRPRCRRPKPACCRRRARVVSVQAGCTHPSETSTPPRSRDALARLGASPAGQLADVEVGAAADGDAVTVATAQVLVAPPGTIRYGTIDGERQAALRFVHMLSARAAPADHASSASPLSPTRR